VVVPHRGGRGAARGRGKPVPPVQPDRVFGSYDRLAEASQWQQWLSLKFEIEEMRKHSSIVGYVITEFTDLHWESNGLLDMCRNPKVFHKRMAAIQGQDLLIPDHTRTNFCGGERFVLPVLLSHFSRHDLGDATLHWQVEGIPDLQGQLLTEEAPPIGTSALGEIVFRVPDSGKARQVTLRMRLLDRAGVERAANHETFCFFPASARQIDLRPAVFVHDPLRLFPNAAAVLAEAGVRRADRLEPGVLCLAGAVDEKLLHFVERGGAALLLALERESLPRTTSGLGSIGRDKNGWWGDWCSGLNWFKPEGARAGGPWASLPQTRQFDFAFRNVVPKRVLVGFDAVKDFDDIWAGLFVGWVHYPAAFAGGFRYGSGKVLATTFDLLRYARTDPISVVMLGDLLRFVASPKFDPRKVVEMTRVELSHTLIPTGEEKNGGATWRYTTTVPKGDWTAPDYDDRGWKSGKSGFGRGLSQVNARTRWKDADIWLRIRVEAPPEGIANASLRFFHDDDFEVYVNGAPLLAREGYTTDYQDHALAPDQVALFRGGANVVCVHCLNHTGPQFVDVGITVEPAAAAAVPRDESAGTLAAGGNGRGPVSPVDNPATSGTEMARHEEKTLQTTGGG
jgi:hypothetical protein